jgi:hypothetical protein
MCDNVCSRVVLTDPQQSNSQPGGLESMVDISTWRAERLSGGLFFQGGTWSVALTLFGHN